MPHSNRTATVFALVGLIGLGMPSLVNADPITPGDGWHSFSWTGAPSAPQTESPFTFTSAAPTDLVITDAFVAGDRFEVYDNGVLIGTTSQVNGFGNWTSDPDVAYPSGQFSTALISLPPGEHSLTFKNIQIPTGYTSGTGFFRVDSFGVPSEVPQQVPEPATLTLVALGVAGLSLRRVRRRLLGSGSAD